MYLTSPPPSPESSSPSRRRQPKRAASSRHGHRMATVELTAKLVVNGLLLGASVVSLTRLVPILREQRAELQQVKAAVAIAEQEHSRLKNDFGRYFDPQQVRSIMQEQSGWESPSQRQIVWTTPQKSTQPSE